MFDLWMPGTGAPPSGLRFDGLDADGSVWKGEMAGQVSKQVTIAGKRPVEVAPVVGPSVDSNAARLDALSADASAQGDKTGGGGGGDGGGAPPGPPGPSGRPTGAPGGVRARRPPGAAERPPADGTPAWAQPLPAQRPIEHYKIEIKAWIPHASVVDPEEPIRATDYLDTAMDSTDAINPLGVGPDFEFHSEYRGDNHGGYEGSYRVLSSIEFDFDGVSITNVKRVGDYGTTHRDWEAKATLNLLFGELTVGEWSDTEEGTATSATGQSASQSSFSLSIASANPLVMTWAPEINATLNGTIASDGTLSLSYDTDLFPSHGIQVSRDGQVIHTAVTNNAERVKAQGAVGAANVGARLMMQENEGGITIPGDP